MRNKFFSALPRAEILSLPRAEILSLPRAEILSLPRAEILSLPRAEILSLPRAEILSLPRAEILSLSNFQKICLYFLISRSSFYDNRLTLEFMKKNYKWKNFSIHLPKEYKIERGIK